MVSFLRLLEPVNISEGSTFIRRGHQVQEIYFMMDNSVSVGYKISTMFLKMDFEDFDIPYDPNKHDFARVKEKVIKQVIKSAEDKEKDSKLTYKTLIKPG